MRHGETEWSRDGRHTGRTDVELTAEGRALARGLRPCLAGWRLARVWCSPLVRARETAALAGFTSGVEVDADLGEWDYGDYEGLTTGEIRRRRPGWTLWSDGAPQGEDAQQVGRRVDRVIDRVGLVDGDVALFAHGHVLRVLAARWIGLPPEAGRSFVFDTAHAGVLGSERGEAAIRHWNVGAGGWR